MLENLIPKSKIWGDLEPEVEELLKNPALLYKVKCELDRFIVGEDKNKLLLWLICASSYTKFPLSAIIAGESSAGKSWLMNNVLRYFDNVEEFTRITEAAPDRLGQDFSHRILKVEELKGTDKAQASLRVWISEGKLRLLTTSPDSHETEVIETKGIPTFITSCTDVNVDTELLNRVFFLSMDESMEQTKRILEFEAEEYSILGIQHYKEANPIFKKIFQPLMYIDKVIIPYAHVLAKNFPIPEGREASIKPRRDFKKLLFLIGTIAWLHQMQRIIVEDEERIRYVVASPSDFLMAWSLCEETMKSTLLNVSKRHALVLEALKRQPSMEATASEIAVLTGYSQNRAREILNSLTRIGLVTRDESSKPYRYKLVVENNVKFDTIDKIVKEIASNYEEQLSNGLVNHARTTKLKPIYIPNQSWNIYVNPLTGKQHDILTRTNFVVRASSTEKNSSLTLQESQEEPTNLPIVPKSESTQQLHRLEDLKAVCWVDGEFNFHPCGICGYSKLTGWQAVTFKNEKLWLCDDCREEWEKQRRVNA